MKKLLLLIFSLTAADLLQAQEYTEELQITGEVINNLSKGQTTLVYDLFDDKMKSAITLD